MLTTAWGSVLVARKGELLDVTAFPGFVAALEVVSLSTTVEGKGVGRALLTRCVADARSRGCGRLWLTTTNNNVRAIDFYQRFGLDLCAFYRNGVDASRRVKPSIPLRDERGVPLAHELEFELVL